MDLSETPQLLLTALVLQLVQVWLWSVNNEGCFTWRTKYFSTVPCLLLHGSFWNSTPISHWE